MRGIAKDSYDEVATQLGISPSAVERAYCVAFDTLELASDRVLRNANVPKFHIDKELTL